MLPETSNNILDLCIELKQYTPLDHFNSALVPFLLMPAWLILSLAICPIILHRYKSSVTTLMNKKSSDRLLDFSPNSKYFNSNNSIDIRRDQPAELQIAIQNNARHYRWMIVGLTLIFSLFLSVLVNISIFEREVIDNVQLFALDLTLYFIIILNLGTCNFRAALIPIKIILLYLFSSTICAICLLILRQTLVDTSYIPNPIGLLIFTIPLTLLLYIGICGRQARTIAPYFTIAISLAGAMMFLVVAVFMLGACSFQLYDESWVSTAFQILVIIGIVTTLAKSLSFVADLYIRKRISERHLSYISWILIVSGSILVNFVDEKKSGFKVDLSAILLIIGMAFGILMCIKIVRSKHQVKSVHRLLFLRVFGGDKKGERLALELKDYWSFIGPINLIVGPDLAKSTFGPNELYLFVTRRLKNLFIDSSESAKISLATIDSTPDPDGRYRVNNLFCLDHIWETVAHGLIRQTDYILLDLRGFNISRVGTAKEVLFLSSERALSKTLILVESENEIYQYIKIVRDISGEELSACQFVTERQWDVETQIQRILHLGHNNYVKRSDEQSNETTLSTSLNELGKTISKYHQKIIEKHNQKNYKFSYIVLIFALIGVVFANYYCYLLTPLYLLLRKVSIARVLVVLAVSQFYASFNRLMVTLIIPFAERSDSQLIIWYTLLISLVVLFLWPIVWIRISKKGNLWIAEGQEPLRSSLKFANE